MMELRKMNINQNIYERKEYVNMKERLYEILKEKEQFLQDNETIILIKNREIIAQYNNGEELCEVNGIINKRLEWLLDCLYDENENYCKSLEESYCENVEFDEQMAEELMCVSFEVDSILKGEIK